MEGKFLSDMSDASPRDNQSGKMSKTAVFKYATLIAAAPLFLYLFVGTIIFPQWFFGLYWDGKVWDRKYLLDGFYYWWLGHFTLSGLAVIFALAAIWPLVTLRKRLAPLAARIFCHALFAIIFLCTSAAIIDHKVASADYTRWHTFADSFVDLKSAIKEIDHIGAPSEISEPVDFQYMDRDRVERLYSQIEPDLIEKTRTITGKRQSQASAGVSAGSVTANAGISKESSSVSGFERPAFSPERQCIEVVNNLLQQPSRFYADGEVWIRHKIAEDYKRYYEQFEVDSRPQYLLSEQLEALKISPGAPGQIAQDGKLLEAELQRLSGLIIVDAMFDVEGTSRSDVTLHEVFSDKPRPMVFEIVVPGGAQSGLFESGTKKHSRVLATVVEPLNDKGILKARAIAVF
jgi:hypothetical protein